MATREEMIAQLEHDAKTVKERLERLRKPIAEAEDDLNHIQGMLAYYRRGAKVADLEEAISAALTLIPTARLRGMTHSAAVVAIAKHNGGLIRTQDAKRLMIKAGIMSDTKNATSMTFRAITQTDRFEHVGPGEYRLKELPTENKDHSELFETPVPPVQ
jgi:hypothetical protein